MDYWVDLDRRFAPSTASLPMIHKTSTWESLEQILLQGFRPSYCKEYIANNNGKYKEACFPMISLSNMSVDDAISWQKSYGTFGIALKKEWAENNNFNAVLYLERKI